MSRVSKVTTTVVSTSTTIVKSSTTVLNVAVDLREALAMSIQLTYKWNVAPTAGKILNLYAIYSEDDSVYDQVNTNTMIWLGCVVLTADTTEHTVSILVDPTKIAPKYVKFVLSTDEATNDGTISSLKATVMRAL